MKTLQNDHTTPEQSKRLLELGVPADSANYVYDCALIGGEKYYSLSILEDELFSVYKRRFEDPCTDIIPCWSVGRLIEISRICTTLPEEEYMFPFWYDTQDNIEWAIRVIESGCRTEHMDFSKLEE